MMVDFVQMILLACGLGLCLLAGYHAGWVRGFNEAQRIYWKR